MSHFDRHTGFLHRPAFALAALALIVLVVGLAYPVLATAITVILTFDAFKEAIAKLPQKHILLMYVANQGGMTVAVATPSSSNTIWSIQPPPSEADFLAAFPKAVSVTTLGGG